MPTTLESHQTRGCKGSLLDVSLSRATPGSIPDSEPTTRLGGLRPPTLWCVSHQLAGRMQSVLPMKNLTQNDYKMIDPRRRTWPELCSEPAFLGRWVALDECQYDETTGHAVEGHVVDVDEDLAELCGRIRKTDCTSCAIVYIAEEEHIEMQ